MARSCALIKQGTRSIDKSLAADGDTEMYFRVSEPTYPTLPPIPTYCTNTGISLENAGLRRITAGWPALTRLRVP
jgi:hypothetical protein